MTLKEARKASGLSYDDVLVAVRQYPEAFWMSRSTIARLESTGECKSAEDAVRLSLLARVLGVKVSEIDPQAAELAGTVRDLLIDASRWDLTPAA